MRTTLELVIGCLEELRLAASFARFLVTTSCIFPPLITIFREVFLWRVATFPVRHCVDRYLYRHQYDRRATGQHGKLPIFLDSIGTLISAVLLGP